VDANAHSATLAEFADRPSSNQLGLYTIRVSTVTTFERAVLTVLARAEEPLGWYRIERGLSDMALPERPNLLEVLSELRRRGLVEQIETADEPKVRHALTGAGRAAIEASREVESNAV